MKFKILGFLGVLMSFLYIASIPTLAQTQVYPFYVLDGWGGVHAGGWAPVITPATPYFGWDTAKAIQYVPVGHTSSAYGDGYIVLDGYGGIHRGGALTSLPSIQTTPYFGWDIARDLAMRLIPPRVAFINIAHDWITFSEFEAFYDIEYVCLTCPDDGYVILSASILLQGGASANSVYYAFGIDGNISPLENVYAVETLQPGDLETKSFTQTVPVSMGYHYFRFIIRLASPGSIRYHNTTMTALYVDHNDMGVSTLSQTEKRSYSEGIGSIK